ncbi:hypothetical protein CC86DRAFT_376916 [Ophiobolus disseminans]|uniref:Uncharacterized protein n=1 Tax=Ophiobolus disseminans TaxID=1469910 RepID=A0A6A7AKN7_9PLEO|nr:hypothetical protein CC86DRAFT_376916 [Ophiobolus disseminans]
MSNTDAPISSASDFKDDGDTTPRQRDFEHSPHTSSDAPPPPYSAPATERDSLLSHDYMYRGSEQLWRDLRPQLRHVPPSLERADESSQEDGDSAQTVRRRNASLATSGDSYESSLPSIDFNELYACIAVWLLTCLVVAAATTAAVVIWMLVTQ